MNFKSVDAMINIQAEFTGEFIGGVAGVDDANRGNRLPDLEGYQRKLAEGKSIIVVKGHEAVLITAETK